MEIRIPRLGWSMEEGVFAGWLKKAGEAVRSGEPLFTLEGEKATQDIESIGEGVLHLAPDAPVAGQVVLVGRLIGLLCPAGEEPAWAGLSSAPVPAPANPIQANPTRTVAASVNSILAATPATLAATAASVAASPSVRRLARQMGIDLNRVVPAWPGGRVGDHDLRPATIAGAPPTGRLLATPRARRLARLQGVDLAGLSGTGAKGRIRERDVPVVGPAKAAELPANAQAISSTRRTIARHMLKSRQETVPVTLTTRADATALLALRANLKHGHGVDAPTFNDMILKILADLLLAHPQMGARWEETHLVLPGEKIDVGLAVDSPAGLVVVSGGSGQAKPGTGGTGPAGEAWSRGNAGWVVHPDQPGSLWGGILQPGDPLAAVCHSGSGHDSSAAGTLAIRAGGLHLPQGIAA